MQVLQGVLGKRAVCSSLVRIGNQEPVRQCLVDDEVVYAACERIPQSHRIVRGKRQGDCYVASVADQLVG